MSQTRVCPDCGTVIPADSPAGQCPKCLLREGFRSGVSSQQVLDATAPSPASAGFEPPPIDELAPLFPQLELLELIGKGGMGAVYKARQKGLDRLVAVKILPPEVGRDPAFAERFTREARAMARLGHPHIVSIYDFGQSNGQFYFVMEYIDGANLRQVTQSKQLTPAEALAVVPQICDALQYAHDEGIVHRDIKPENILVDKRGRVKIADFGLSKLLREQHAEVSLTGTHQVMGTLRYMAPEQMEGTKSVDHRADIYSLGVVFYELLTGQVPMGRFDPPSKKVQVDVRLDEVVLRALEQEPEKRYQQASDVKSQLDVIKQSAATPASPASAVATAPDHVVARRLTFILLGLISLAVAAFIALQVGYLQGAPWYFEQELPYRYLSTFWTVLSGLGMAYFVWWWYLLAKDPSEERSFAGLMRQFQTPDPRAKRFAFLIPLLFVLGALVGAVPLFLSLAGYSDAVQSVAMTSVFVILPYAMMFIVSRIYRREPSREPAVSETAPANRIGAISMWAAISGLVAPMLLGIVGQMFVATDRLAGYIILCFALAVGLELAALGCGIAARRTRSGKAGIVISIIALLGALLSVSVVAVVPGGKAPAPSVHIESSARVNGDSTTNHLLKPTVPAKVDYFEGHTAEVQDVVVTPDSRTVVSAGADGKMVYSASFRVE